MYDDNNNILEEVADLKDRKNKNFSTVVNKRKLNRFDMDDFFMGG